MIREKFVAEIINALGTRIRTSDQEKLDFALYLDEELFCVIGDAQDKENYAKIYGKIEDSAQSAETALKAFQKSIYEARRTFKSITKLSDFLGDRFTKDCDLKHIIEYFEKYNAQLVNAKPTKKKRGPHKLTSDGVAQMIALHYRDCFGAPSTGKGEIYTIGNNDKIKTTLSRPL